jgi:hypothetical protein
MDGKNLVLTRIWFCGCQAVVFFLSENFEGLAFQTNSCEVEFGKSPFIGIELIHVSLRHFFFVK